MGIDQASKFFRQGEFVTQDGKKIWKLIEDFVSAEVVEFLTMDFLQVLVGSGAASEVLHVSENQSIQLCLERSFDWIDSILASCSCLKGLILFVDGAPFFLKSGTHSLRYESRKKILRETNEKIDGLEQSVYTNGSISNDVIEHYESLYKKNNILKSVFDKVFFAIDYKLRTNPKYKNVLILRCPYESDPIFALLQREENWFHWINDWDAVLFPNTKKIIMDCDRVGKRFKVIYVDRLFLPSFTPQMPTLGVGCFTQFEMFHKLPLIFFAILVGSDFFRLGGESGLNQCGPVKAHALIKSCIDEAVRKKFSPSQFFAYCVNEIQNSKQWQKAIETFDTAKRILKRDELVLSVLYYYGYAPVVDFQISNSTNLFEGLQSGNFIAKQTFINKPIALLAGVVPPRYGDHDLKLLGVGSDITSFVKLEDLKSKYATLITSPSFFGYSDFNMKRLLFACTNKGILSDVLKTFNRNSVPNTGSRVEVLKSNIITLYSVNAKQEGANMLLSDRKKDQSAFGHRKGRLVGEGVDELVNLLSLILGRRNKEIPSVFEARDSTTVYKGSKIIRSLTMLLAGHITDLEKFKAFEDEGRLIILNENTLPSMSSAPYSTSVVFSGFLEKDLFLEKKDCYCTCIIGMKTEDERFFCAHKIANLLLLGIILKLLKAGKSNFEIVNSLPAFLGRMYSQPCFLIPYLKSVFSSTEESDGEEEEVEVFDEKQEKELIALLHFDNSDSPIQLRGLRGMEVLTTVSLLELAHDILIDRIHYSGFPNPNFIVTGSSLQDKEFDVVLDNNDDDFLCKMESTLKLNMAKKINQRKKKDT